MLCPDNGYCPPYRNNDPTTGTSCTAGVTQCPLKGNRCLSNGIFQYNATNNNTGLTDATDASATSLSMLPFGGAIPKITCSINDAQKAPLCPYGSCAHSDPGCRQCTDNAWMKCELLPLPSMRRACTLGIEHPNRKEQGEYNPLWPLSCPNNCLQVPVNVMKEDAQAWTENCQKIATHVTDYKFCPGSVEIVWNPGTPPNAPNVLHDTPRTRGSGFRAVAVPN